MNYDSKLPEQEIAEVYMIMPICKRFRTRELTDDNREELDEYLTGIEENRENRPFLNKYIVQVAEFLWSTNMYNDRCLALVLLQINHSCNSEICHN